MSSLTHIAFGGLCTATLLAINNISIQIDLYPILACIFASILPDIDSPTSILGRISGNFSSWINKKYGHRTTTHSLITTLILSVIVYIAEKFLAKEVYYTYIFSTSYLSHIILDLATVKGVQIFYPLSSTNYVIFLNKNYRLKSGDRKHELIVFAVIMTAFYLLSPLHKQGISKLLNKNIHTVKNVYEVASSSNNITEIEYDVRISDKNYSGKGTVVKSTKNHLIIFDNGFLTIDSNAKINKLSAKKTDNPFSERKISFKSIPYEKMMQIIKDKPIIYLSIKGDPSLIYKTNGKITKTKILNLEYVYNPQIFLDQQAPKKSLSDIDSQIKTLEEKCRAASLGEREDLTKELVKLRREKNSLTVNNFGTSGFDVEVTYITDN